MIDRRRAALQCGAMAAVAVALLLGVAGCGGPASEDLRDPLEQSRSSVRTVELALDQMTGHQLTAAGAQVATSDAADEIAKAQRDAGKAKAPSPAERSQRTQTLTAIGQARVVVLDTEDVLSKGGDVAGIRVRLQQADAALADAFDALGPS